MLRLPPGSRVRRAFVVRAARASFEAWVRGDYDVLRAAADPEIEVRLAQTSGTNGFEVPVASTRSTTAPTDTARPWQLWAQSFRNWRAEVDEVIEEAPDRILIVARHSGEGIASGVKLEQWGAIRYTVRTEGSCERTVSSGRQEARRRGTRRRPVTRQTFEDAERRLFGHFGLTYASCSLALDDPALSIGVREAGTGDPVVFVHGSGMSGATWAPVLVAPAGSQGDRHRSPRFGLSDPYSYSAARRAHATASSRPRSTRWASSARPLVGTSLGAMWSLCFALGAPERVSAVVAIGMPAVALPGVRADPFFRVMTIPGLGRVASRVLPVPKSVKGARRGMKGVIGQAAGDRTPDEFFEVVSAGMRMPGWREAMWTHLTSLPIRARAAGERSHRRGTAFDRDAGPVHLGPGRRVRRP